ncbi:unnamed protein product [Macrosiphum euphorbiae]|uniref:Uncharacterized protein n=1 Tax=Macrosiphum euphorbiae TaxID=13131 RepID=A0AAV0XVG0_9HEMI|nr:unnamed protein product [Macrosiphum euphorbiae]
MNIDDGLFVACNSLSDFSDQFIVDDSSLSNDLLELQPLATSNNPTPLSEDDKTSIRNLLDGWNMGYLFQTCLSEFKCITSIAAIICSD